MRTAWKGQYRSQFGYGWFRTQWMVKSSTQWTGWVWRICQWRPAATSKQPNTQKHKQTNKSTSRQRLAQTSKRANKQTCDQSYVEKTRKHKNTQTNNLREDTIHKYTGKQTNKQTNNQPNTQANKLKNLQRARSRRTSSIEILNDQTNWDVCTALINSEDLHCRIMSSLGTFGRSLDLDLRVCTTAAPPAPAPTASGNLGLCPPWDWGRNTWFSNGMADKRSTICHEKISKRVLPYSLFDIYLPKHVEYSWEWFDEDILTSGQLLLREIEKWAPDMFP